VADSSVPVVTAVADGAWSLEAFMIHTSALRAADERFYAERDRRYAEVDLEREKALKIKETADETARVLAREIQTYKDEKANDLRSQIESERGTYVTHSELTLALAQIAAEIKPVTE
jgi:hypothetical protein